jgi:rubrerythrin
MILNTASEGISLARKLENDSAGFYEELARRNQQHAEPFLAFARENKKNIAHIDRVYYGVITDAIEGSYAFNIDTDDYICDISLTQGESYTDSLNRAIAIEEKIVKFYLDATEQSKSLMADLPRAFEMVARKRTARISTIRSLISTIDGG